VLPNPRASLRSLADGSHDPENPPRAEGGGPPAVLALRLLFRLSGTVAPTLAARRDCDIVPLFHDVAQPADLLCKGLQS